MPRQYSRDMAQRTMRTKSTGSKASRMNVHPLDTHSLRNMGKSGGGTTDVKKQGAVDGKASVHQDRHILDIPFEERYAARAMGVKYDKGTKTNYYDGELPEPLKEWSSPDYSYARWVEDQYNKRIRPVEQGPVMFTPRAHQVEARDAILAAYDSGWPGFLIADSTGLGKTLSIVAGVCAVAREQGRTPSRRLKTLIVCPKGAMGVWRQTLKAYGDSSRLRPLVINYQRLNKLIREPESARKAKTARTKNRRIARDGSPKIHFDVIVFDESHYLKNYGSSGMSLAASTIAGLDKAYEQGASPFVIYSTATPGSTPLNMAIMAPTLARAIDPKTRRHVSPAAWGQFLSQEGFHVSKGKSGWNWVNAPWYKANSNDPREREQYERAKRRVLVEQEEDTKRIGEAWASDGAPFIARDPTQLRDWPKQPVEPFYIELDATGRRTYEKAWTEFRDYLDLKRKGASDPKDALTANLRFRQKASILKAGMIADHAADLVEEGNQVFIGCEFLETVDIILAGLASRHVTAVEFTGRNTEEREHNRILFQKGEASVIVSNVAEAVSFHAGEVLPDGSAATMNQRISIIADVRQNPNDCIQQMGRAHREGQCSPCEFPVILDTVDVKVMDSFIKKARNLNQMKSADDPDYLDRVFEDIV